MRCLRRAIAKRKEIMSRRRASDAELAKWFRAEQPQLLRGVDIETRRTTLPTRIAARR